MRIRSRNLLGFVTTVALFLPMTSGGVVIYQNDFQGVVGSEWSNTTTEVPPADANRRFLGRFADDTVSLSLGSIPTHTELLVEFELLITSSWDGDGPENSPDIWSLNVNGGPVLLHTTFSNFPDRTQDYPSAYDDVPDGAINPPKTGAAEVNTLGYPGFLDFPGGDSVYYLSFLLPHTASTVTLDFIGGPGLTSVSDEGWGIDNISVNAVPEPSTALLLSAGLAWLGQRSRRSVFSRS